MQRKSLGGVLISLILAACSAPAPPAPEEPAGSAIGQPWQLDAQTAGGIRSASCPAGTDRLAPVQIPLRVRSVSAGSPDQIAAVLPGGVRLSNAWELSSDHIDFGGLSGLALLPEEDGGGLLAVTDAGSFVWIGFEEETPATASLARMQASDARPYPRKSDADAEGLVYLDGLALVSFERRFRIEGFDLRGCGAAARAALIAGLPDTHDDQRIDDNQGPEALFVSPDGHLGFGYEGMLGLSPLGRVMQDGSAEWTGLAAPSPPAHGLVGREEILMPDGQTRTLELFRAWDPVQGNRIRLSWGPDPEQSVDLGLPLLTDNFEGLAAEARPDGALRIWIVSDDNFSARQRTLLYVFDIAP